MRTSIKVNVKNNDCHVIFKQDLQWNGLEQGSVFQRPKANVLVTLEGVSNLDVNHVAKYPVTPVCSYLHSVRWIKLKMVFFDEGSINLGIFMSDVIG